MSRAAFVKGEQVEFQDYKRCWRQGTVQLMEQAVQGRGALVHVLFFDSFQRTMRTMRLNPKRVRRLVAA